MCVAASEWGILTLPVRLGTGESFTNGLHCDVLDCAGLLVWASRVC